MIYDAVLILFIYLFMYYYELWLPSPVANKVSHIRVWLPYCKRVGYN